jgi:hypothetical protein
VAVTCVIIAAAMAALSLLIPRVNLPHITAGGRR